MIQILATNTIRNTGDRACLPNLYFPQLLNARILWLGERSVDPDGLLIVGGGGLFRNGNTLDLVLASLRSHRGPKVLWGPGLNNDGAVTNDRYPTFLDTEFALLGVRDVVDRYEWLPCVSCMSEEFDRPPLPQVPIVVYHGAEPVQNCGDVPRASCEGNFKLSESIAFLASGETVVTSSYHGWYWATLLGRRVVLVPGRNCSKFFHLPIPSVIAGAHNWRKTAMRDVPRYLGFIQRCRMTNQAFMDRVESKFAINFKES